MLILVLNILLSDGSLRFKLLNVLVIHYFTKYQEMYLNYTFVLYKVSIGICVFFLISYSSKMLKRNVRVISIRIKSNKFKDCLKYWVKI